jgi:hypothetical protein
MSSSDRQLMAGWGSFQVPPIGSVSGIYEFSLWNLGGECSKNARKIGRVAPVSVSGSGGFKPKFPISAANLTFP